MYHSVPEHSFVLQRLVYLVNIDVRCSLGSAALLVETLHRKTGGSGFDSQ